MTKTVHMSLSVRGALAWPKRKLRMFSDPKTGKPAKPEDVREWLMDHLSQGHEVIPLARCEGFDFKEGCPGHPESEEAKP